jgi:hypothetical protein
MALHSRCNAIRSGFNRCKKIHPFYVLLTNLKDISLYGRKRLFPASQYRRNGLIPRNSILWTLWFWPCLPTRQHLGNLSLIPAMIYFLCIYFINLFSILNIFEFSVKILRGHIHENFDFLSLICSSRKTEIFSNDSGIALARLT